MLKSIKYFEENCISIFEKLEDDFMKNPTALAEYVIGLTAELHNLGIRMLHVVRQIKRCFVRQIISC